MNSYDERVASADPEARAGAVRRAIGQAEAAGLQSAGSCATTSTRIATANSAGLFYDQQRTDAQFVMTAMSDDSSGWAQSSGYRWDQLDPDRAARRAVEKALAARSPREIPSGKYTVILEPNAAA
ncbi:MAG: TldD/PmbA family protein, partial [Myxococcota bacterium]